MERSQYGPGAVGSGALVGLGTDQEGGRLFLPAPLSTSHTTRRNLSSRGVPITQREHFAKCQNRDVDPQRRTTDWKGPLGVISSSPLPAGQTQSLPPLWASAKATRHPLRPGRVRSREVPKPQEAEPRPRGYHSDGTRGNGSVPALPAFPGEGSPTLLRSPGSG